MNQNQPEIAMLTILLATCERALELRTRAKLAGLSDGASLDNQPN